MSTPAAARRALRRFLAVLPLVLLIVLGPATSASAHAYLTTSFPADGATLPAGPTVLRLHFSESVDLSSTRIDVVDEHGRHHALGGLRIVRGDDTEEPSSITAPLPHFARGVYRVSWETLSSDDLHRTSGVFSFGIDRAVARTPFHEPLPRAEEALLRWIAFGALALVCGGLVMGRLAAAGSLRVRKGIAAWTLAGAAAGPLVALALLVDQVRNSGASLTHLLGTDYGLRWTVREAGLLALLVGVLLTRRGRRRGVSFLIGAGVTVAAAGSALLGHAAALPGNGPTRVLADAVHLIAAATWAGSVATAALVARRDPTAMRTSLRSFAWVALAGLTTVVVTGVYLTSGVVGSVDAALYTWYGRAVMLKIGLLGAVTLLAAVNHRRVRATGRSWRGPVAFEAVALGLALAAAAFLTSGQPAREPEFVAASGPAPTRQVDGLVADLQERVQVGPNRPGRNIAVVDVYDTRRPAPAPIQAVLVRVVGADGSGSTPTAATPLAIRGRWSATVAVPSPGALRVEVTVVRSGLPPVRHAFGWVVARPVADSRPARISTAPLYGPLRDLSVVLFGVAALGWAGAAALRRRPAGSNSPTAPADAFRDDVPERAGALSR